MPSDPHQDRVYLMERVEMRGIRWYSSSRLRTLRRCAKRVCKLYDVPQVSVTIRAERGIGASYNEQEDRFWIYLHPKYRNLVMLAHEIAHHIAWTRHGNRVQTHGPRWLRYYAEVLHVMRVMPIEGMQALCRRHGLRMAPPLA